MPTIPAPLASQSIAAAASKPIAPRVGWVDAEPLPTNLPAAAKLLPSKFGGSNASGYIARSAFKDLPGTEGVYLMGEEQYAGHSLPAALAAARDLAAANRADKPATPNPARGNDVAVALTQSRNGRNFYVDTVYGWGGNPENEYT